jgi:hypothetical protein
MRGRTDFCLPARANFIGIHAFETAKTLKMSSAMSEEIMSLSSIIELSYQNHFFIHARQRRLLSNPRSMGRSCMAVCLLCKRRKVEVFGLALPVPPKHHLFGIIAYVVQCDGHRPTCLSCKDIGLACPRYVKQPRKSKASHTIVKASKIVVRSTKEDVLSRSVSSE